jgi:hypothetical protein
MKNANVGPTPSGKGENEWGYSVENDKGGCMQHEEMTEFNDQSNEQTNTVAQCAERCFHHHQAGCRYFTFGHNEKVGECHLLKSCPHYTTDPQRWAYKLTEHVRESNEQAKSNLSTFSVYNEGGCTGDGKRYIGEESHKAVSGANECAQLCSEDSHCLYFSVSHFHGTDRDSDGKYDGKYHCHMLNSCNKQEMGQPWTAYQMEGESEGVGNHYESEDSQASGVSTDGKMVLLYIAGACGVVAAMAVTAYLVVNKARKAAPAPTVEETEQMI